MENMESLDTKETRQKNQEYYNSLADKLEKMNNKANEGRGSQVVRYIISDLRNGNIDTAKRSCEIDSDKFYWFPELKEVIKNELFEEGEEHPWSIIERLKKQD